MGVQKKLELALKGLVGEEDSWAMRVTCWPAWLGLGCCRAHRLGLIGPADLGLFLWASSLGNGPNAWAFRPHKIIPKIDK